VSRRRKAGSQALSGPEQTRHQNDPARWRSAGIVALLAVATLAAYADSFSAAFVFDDRPHIFANDRIQSVFPLSKTLSGRRPLVDLTLALNHAVDRTDPTGYHVVNVLIHLLAGCTLFALLRRLLTDRSEPPRPTPIPATWIAGIVSLLWLLHPLQTQAVTYVIQRGESLMGLCYLLTLYCAVRGMSGEPRAWLWYAGSILACGLGMAAKAVMVTSPIAVFLYDWIVVSRSPLVALRRRWPLYFGLFATWLVLVWCGVATGVLSTTPHPKVNVGFAVDDVTPLDYLMTQPDVILHYLRLAFWPNPLCIDYGWPFVTSLSGAVVPGIVLIVLLGASVWSAWRRPLAGFAGLCFFLILAPTSSIVPIRDAIFEHRMYLPLAVVVSLVVTGCAMLGARFGDRLGLPPARLRLAGLLLTILVAAALGARTYVRNEDYKTDRRLWEAAVAVRPDNPRAQYSLGVALGREATRAADPAMKQALRDRSIEQFRRVLQISGPRTRKDVLAEAHYQIGWYLIRTDRPAEAATEFEKALSLNDTHVEATFELGFAYAMMERYDEAIEKFRRTLELAPTHAQAKEYLAVAEKARRKETGND